MLRAMFSGRMDVAKDENGWVLIDRCGKHFSTILNFLRNGYAPLPEKRREVEELLEEAKFYLIQDLITQCEISLEKMRVAKLEPKCSVPVSFRYFGSSNST